MARAGCTLARTRSWPIWFKQVEVTGADQLPREGPLLLAANHPGLGDVLAILATVERADLRVVAADYPLLRALPGVNQHFLYVPREPGQRLHVLRAIVTQLQADGAVLLLPAGSIEPDRPSAPMPWLRSIRGQPALDSSPIESHG